MKLLEEFPLRTCGKRHMICTLAGDYSRLRGVCELGKIPSIRINLLRPDKTSEYVYFRNGSLREWVNLSPCILAVCLAAPQERTATARQESTATATATPTWKWLQHPNRRTLPKVKKEQFLESRNIMFGYVWGNQHLPIILVLL